MAELAIVLKLERGELTTGLDAAKSQATAAGAAIGKDFTEGTNKAAAAQQGLHDKVTGLQTGNKVAQDARKGADGLDSMKEAAGHVDEVLGELGVTGGALGRVLSALTSPVALVAGALVGLIALGKSLIDGWVANAREQQNLAAVAGATVTQTHNVQTAFRLAGEETGNFERALFKVSQQVDDGGQVFEKYGIAIRDASGNLRQPLDIFLEWRDRVSGMTSAVERNAAAQDVLGRSGLAMLPILSMSREEFEHLQEVATKKFPWSEDQQRQMQDYIKAAADLDATWQGLKAQLLTPIVGHVTIMFSNISKGLEEWKAGGESTLDQMINWFKGKVAEIPPPKIAPEFDDAAAAAAAGAWMNWAQSVAASQNQQQVDAVKERETNIRDAIASALEARGTLYKDEIQIRQLVGSQMLSAVQQRVSEEGAAIQNGVAANQMTQTQGLQARLALLQTEAAATRKFWDDRVADVKASSKVTAAELLAVETQRQAAASATKEKILQLEGQMTQALHSQWQSQAQLRTTTNQTALNQVTSAIKQNLALQESLIQTSGRNEITRANEVMRAKIAASDAEYDAVVDNIDRQWEIQAELWSRGVLSDQDAHQKMAEIDRQYVDAVIKNSEAVAAAEIANRQAAFAVTQKSLADSTKLGQEATAARIAAYGTEEEAFLNKLEVETFANTEAWKKMGLDADDYDAKLAELRSKQEADTDAFYEKQKKSVQGAYDAGAAIAGAAWEGESFKLNQELGKRQADVSLYFSELLKNENLSVDEREVIQGTWTATLKRLANQSTLDKALADADYLEKNRTFNLDLQAANAAKDAAIKASNGEIVGFLAAQFTIIETKYGDFYGNLTKATDTFASGVHSTISTNIFDVLTNGFDASTVPKLFDGFKNAMLKSFADLVADQATSSLMGIGKSVLKGFTGEGGGFDLVGGISTVLGGVASAVSEFLDFAAVKKILSFGGDIFSAIGGFLGFATGGIVPGLRPNGPDTVPALLTPGEMVLTPEQTQQFLEFVDQIAGTTFAGSGGGSGLSGTVSNVLESVMGEAAGQNFAAGGIKGLLFGLPPGMADIPGFLEAPATAGILGEAGVPVGLLGDVAAGLLEAIPFVSSAITSLAFMPGGEFNAGTALSVIGNIAAGFASSGPPGALIAAGIMAVGDILGQLLFNKGVYEFKRKESAALFNEFFPSLMRDIEQQRTPEGVDAAVARLLGTQLEGFQWMITPPADWKTNPNAGPTGLNIAYMDPTKFPGLAVEKHTTEVLHRQWLLASGAANDPILAAELDRVVRQAEETSARMQAAKDALAAAGIQDITPGGSGGNIGSYDRGGVVPGPLGRPQLAVVHGGEEVLTPEQRRRGGVNVTVNLTPVVYGRERIDWGAHARDIKRAIDREMGNLRN